MKKLKRFFIFSIILLIGLWCSVPIFGTEWDDVDRIRIATWNIRILSDNSRDDMELQKIASLLGEFDIIATQEVRDSAVMDRLMKFLPGYEYLLSPPVGHTVKERYAFIYNSDIINVSAGYLVDDEEDQFLREPFVGHFRAGFFDFTLITVHIVYGRSVTERRAEVQALADVVQEIDILNGEEQDLLLLGDFNLNPDDTAWQNMVLQPLLSPLIMTTVTNSSSYDNIFLNRTATGELLSGAFCLRFDEWMFDDDRTASLEVSDHRPVYAEFDISGPDDDGEWDLTFLNSAISTNEDGFVNK